MVSVSAGIIVHVNEYPTIPEHYFGKPRHTQSMIAFWLSICGNPSQKLHSGNVVNMPYCSFKHSKLYSGSVCRQHNCIVAHVWSHSEVGYCQMQALGSNLIQILRFCVARRQISWAAKSPNTILSHPEYASNFILFVIVEDWCEEIHSLIGIIVSLWWLDVQACGKVILCCRFVIVTQDHMGYSNDVVFWL